MGELKRIGKSLRTAFNGVLFVIRIEQNARIHLIAAVFAILLGVYLQVTNGELAAIFFAIILVFTTEIVNTAIEKILDLIEPDHHTQVRIVKDISAGAVLVSSLGALMIGAAIFAPYILALLWHK